jgi:hypothetical protein
MGIWHYTRLAFLEEIIKSGVIRLTVAGIDPKEQSAVWFSTNPDFELTITSSDEGGKDELHQRGEGPARIEVVPELPFKTWKEHKKESGISKRIAEALELIGSDMGANPDEWLALYQPVPEKYWRSTEVWNGNSWVPFHIDKQDELPISYNHLRFHFLGKNLDMEKCRPFKDLKYLIVNRGLKNTLKSINYPPQPGEAKGTNSHNMSVALMADLMVYRLSEGYKMITTRKHAVGGGDHSWLECEGWSIDASTLLKNPECPVTEDEYHILFGNAFDYRNHLGVRKIHIKRVLTDKEMTGFLARLKL